MHAPLKKMTAAMRVLVLLWSPPRSSRPPPAAPAPDEDELLAPLRKVPGVGLALDGGVTPALPGTCGGVRIPGCLLLRRVEWIDRSD